MYKSEARKYIDDMAAKYLEKGKNGEDVPLDVAGSYTVLTIRYHDKLIVGFTNGVPILEAASDGIYSRVTYFITEADAKNFDLAKVAPGVIVDLGAMRFKLSFWKNPKKCEFEYSVTTTDGIPVQDRVYFWSEVEDLLGPMVFLR